ncbi:MAG: hypothetical protein LBT53_05865 [Puniceicoccales bacterium]|jgi:hypothetical protein|nr:hypothetical protein [Puniceicoccales bacterium]
MSQEHFKVETREESRLYNPVTDMILKRATQDERTGIWRLDFEKLQSYTSPEIYDQRALFNALAKERPKGYWIYEQLEITPLFTICPHTDADA